LIVVVVVFVVLFVVEFEVVVDLPVFVSFLKFVIKEIKKNNKIK